jgi:hypothetical protein
MNGGIRFSDNQAADLLGGHGTIRRRHVVRIHKATTTSRSLIVVRSIAFKHVIAGTRAVRIFHYFDLGSILTNEHQGFFSRFAPRKVSPYFD